MDADSNSREGVCPMASSEDSNAREAQRSYIDRLRAMNPDEVLSERLDSMERELDEQEGPPTPRDSPP
jgi:hypothetical protein